jgi:predicted MFS family arabinose efflux permease
MNALVLMGLSRITGPILGGFSADILGMPATFAISGAVCVAATLVFFLAARKMDWNATPAETQAQ